jgi:hypothetical protein
MPGGVPFHFTFAFCAMLLQYSCDTRMKLSPVRGLTIASINFLRSDHKCSARESVVSILSITCSAPHDVKWRGGGLSLAAAPRSASAIVSGGE